MNTTNLRVWKTPETIEALTHNLSFATDADVNARIITRFRNYDYLTPSVTENTATLQSVINEWKDHAEKLYATTQLTYDPLTDYEMNEEGEIIDEKHKGSKTSSGVDITVTDTPRVERVTDNTGFGYDSDASGAPVGKTTEHAPTGTDSRRTQGDAANNSTRFEDISATVFDKDVRKYDHYKRYGSMAKPQDLIAAERKIIVDVIEFYVEKFAVCFDISNNIAFEPFEEPEETEVTP